MTPTRTAASRAITALTLASITTLVLLAGVARQADRAYADERVAQGADPAVQQVVVVGTRASRS